MDKKSCGALLYAFNSSGELGIILGDESRGDMIAWLPFKGGSRNGETIEETAIRELYEETCGLVKKDSIDLQHRFTTKRKEYYIGLCEVPITIIDDFANARNNETREDFIEKLRLKFFKFPDVLRDPSVHSISKSSILYYYNFLERAALDRINSPPPVHRTRYFGFSYPADSPLNNAKNNALDNKTATIKPAVKPKKKHCKNSKYLFKFSSGLKVIDQTKGWRKTDVVCNV